MSPEKQKLILKSPSIPVFAENRLSTILQQIVKVWGEEMLARALSQAEELTRVDAADTPKKLKEDLKKAAKKAAKKSSFKEQIDAVAESVVEHTAKEHIRLGIPIKDVKLKNLVRVWINKNVQLITKMTSKESAKIADILKEGQGRTRKSISKEIRERLNMTRRRADLIARDQVLTLNAQINQKRMEAAGITHYKWVTAGDQRVRDLHRQLDGKIYAFDDPPVSGTNGEKLNPGLSVNCRCQSFPLIDIGGSVV